MGRVLLLLLSVVSVVRLRPGDPVTVGCLPGVWTAVHTVSDRPGWWRILPKFSTPGLEALASCATIDVRREDLIPLPLQETLL